MKAARWLVTLLALSSMPGIAGAEPAPGTILEDFLARAGALVSADPVHAWPEVQRLATGLFDGEHAARRTLGAEWSRRSEAERSELSRVVGSVMAHAFLEVARARLPRDRPPTMRVLSEDLTPDGTRVRTTIHARDGNDVRLDYLMARPAGRWRVQDVIIEGVSMVENYRAQFARSVRISSPAAAMSALRRLAGAPPAEAAEAPPDGVVAYFDSGGAALAAAARADLDRLADWLNATREAFVVVESYADARGEAGLNRALTERRAAAVRRHLVSRGVAEARVHTIAHGDRQPVCQEATPACWARNRRAVVRPMAGDPAVATVEH